MDENSEKLEQLSKNKYVIAAFLFVISYFFLYVVGSAHSSLTKAVAEIPVLNIFFPWAEFESYMFFIMPFAGFVFMFFLVDWLNGFLKKKDGSSPVVPFVFFVLAILAFYVAIFWYAGNYADLQSNTQVKYNPYICISESQAECNKLVNEANQILIDKRVMFDETRLLQYRPVSFSDRLKGGSYYLFVLGGLLGWLTRFIVHKIKL